MDGNGTPGCNVYVKIRGNIQHSTSNVQRPMGARRLPVGDTAGYQPALRACPAPVHGSNAQLLAWRLSMNRRFSERGSVTRSNVVCKRELLRLTEPRSDRVARFIVPIHAKNRKGAFYEPSSKRF